MWFGADQRQLWECRQPWLVPFWSWSSCSVWMCVFAEGAEKSPRKTQLKLGGLSLILYVSFFPSNYSQPWQSIQIVPWDPAKKRTCAGLTNFGKEPSPLLVTAAVSPWCHTSKQSVYFCESDMILSRLVLVSLGRRSRLITVSLLLFTTLMGCL